jgi:pimeloyl-ACP methyl ester carboxylesterase
MEDAPPAYRARRAASAAFEPVRGLRYHLLHWGDATLATPARPTLVLLHGWMDVGASFQFLVDALAAVEGPLRHAVALDWRGFGSTEGGTADHYAFNDYLGDLDALLDRLAPGARVDLLGHSMGGNVAMLYAGLRPERVRRLVNLEGFGVPEVPPEDTPTRLVRWLDELKTAQRLRPYDDAAAVADRLRRNAPWLRADRAAWLALQWSAPGADGRWHLRADPAHKRVGPTVARRDETIEAWRRIRAPLLWIESSNTDVEKWWEGRFRRSDFESRLAAVPEVERHRLGDCGHMLHHDRPEALAELLAAFLQRAG